MDIKDYFEKVSKKLDEMPDEEFETLVSTCFKIIDKAKKTKGKRKKPWIDSFMKQVNEKYPNLKMVYAYDDDTHWIFHDNKELEFENEEFIKFTGALIKNTIYERNFTNFCFCYEDDIEERIKYGSNQPD